MKLRIRRRKRVAEPVLIEASIKMTGGSSYGR